MNAFLTVAVLAMLWGTVLVRLPTLLRDARQRAIWATWFTLALCRTAALPAVNTMLGRLIDDPEVIPHIGGVASAFFLLRFVSLITDRYATHPHAAMCQFLLACTVTLVLCIFAVLSPDGIPPDGPELMTGAISPPTLAYWVVLEAYLGVVLATATVLFSNMSRSATGPLRHALRCMAVGTFLIALYALLKTAYLAAHAFGVTVTVGAVVSVADGLRAVGVILGIVGAIVPAVGRLRAAATAYRSIHALRPLWRVMRQIFPDIILVSPRRALVEMVGVDDVHLRLYRRIIEIRDGMLALRDYLPACAIDEAGAFLGSRGLLPAERAPVAEACGIALARHRLRSGLPPSGGSSQWASVGADMADEVRWLRAVSAARFRHEPADFVTWWVRRHHADAPKDEWSASDAEPVAPT